MANYKTILSLCSDGCNCDKLKLTDESIIPNDSVGHAVFGYRKITVETPDNTFVYSTLSSENPDQSINVLTSNGINQFNYTFQTTDTDGIYTATLYNFPLWNDSASYVKTSKPIVFYNDILYKCIENNINVNPETDVDNLYWEVYVISDDTLKTRYASQKKTVVLCISIDDCYESLVKKAFCEVKYNPCASMCDNNEFSQAMKMKLTKEAICISEENNDWDLVAKQINILKSICCCGGGC